MTEIQILVETILQALVAGLFIGAIYGLMCVGLAMIFGIMRVINFAQGEFLMLGMYAAYFAFLNFGVQGLFGNIIGPYVGALLAAPVLYLFGWTVHKLFIRQVTGMRTTELDSEGHHAQLVLTLGISLILQNCAMIFFGAGLVSIRTPLSSAAWFVGPLWGDVVSIFLNQARTVAAAVSVVVILILWYVISNSRLGKSLRAAADNPEASTYMGINVEHAHRVAFALGTAITALAGALLATNYPFHPFVGIEYVIIMYAGVVLGGVGSVLGAFWGGMAIGMIQQLSTVILPSQLQNAAIFVIFLLVVTLRPQGFFGQNVERT